MGRGADAKVDEPRHLKVPPEMLDKALDDLRDMYFLRPLRFALRNMPFIL